MKLTGTPSTWPTHLRLACRARRQGSIMYVRATVKFIGFVQQLWLLQALQRGVLLALLPSYQVVGRLQCAKAETAHSFARSFAHDSLKFPDKEKMQSRVMLIGGGRLER